MPTTARVRGESLFSVYEERVEPCFRLHPFATTVVTKSLEAEFRCELEGARTTRTEHTVSAGGRAVEDVSDGIR